MVSTASWLIEIVKKQGLAFVFLCVAVYVLYAKNEDNYTEIKAEIKACHADVKECQAEKIEMLKEHTAAIRILSDAMRKPK
jgi:predicted tellurium resistance membrane protein TerC